MVSSFCDGMRTARQQFLSRDGNEAAADSKAGFCAGKRLQERRLPGVAVTERIRS